MILRCPICRGEKITRHGKRSTFDPLDRYAAFVREVARFDREIVRCSTCGMSFIDPMYDEDDLHALYGEPGYAAFQKVVAPDDDLKSSKGPVLVDIWKGQFRALGIETFGKDVRARTGNAKFLDVGCGFGRNLMVFHELGFEVTGVEINEGEAEAARALGDFRVLSISAQELAKTGERFDCVLASHVLEHVTDPMAFLQMLDRLSAPGGLVVLETPVADDHGLPDQRFRDIYHTLFFDHFTLQLLAARSGYRVTAWQNILFGDADGKRSLFMQLAMARDDSAPSPPPGTLARLRSAYRTLFTLLAMARDDSAPSPPPGTLAHLRSAYDALLGDALTWSYSHLHGHNRQER
jgi:2-polyprenyl-3-methyl-5-hydroxy-6-metoxy-1,4-benzoquinol methylase